ncbi:hypothetical protein [Nocardia colli]|uniref:hypothetical protein n=1 Tax=Nocardia colli TaxID=2545717 RepID=UPI0035E00313
MTWQKGNMLNLPPLDQIVLPRPAVVRRALAEDLIWLVGPPKVGKTLFAYYLAYFHAINHISERDDDLILAFEGPVDSARGIDLILEIGVGPAAAVIFDDPLGVTETRDSTAFLDRLVSLREGRSDLAIVLTSRIAPYLQAEPLVRSRGLDRRTEMTFGYWYDIDDLARRYKGVDVAAGDREAFACPSAIIQYRDHGIGPSSPSQREATRLRYGGASDDTTLDKLRALEVHPTLGLIAILLRLQEYAFSLPTADEISHIIGIPFERIDNAGLVASTFVFDDELRLRFEHSTTREAAELLLNREVAEGLPRIVELIESGRSTWLAHAVELWNAERAAATHDWARLREYPTHILTAIAAQILSVSGGTDEALDVVASLDIDPWTAQDIAYELAAGWVRYSEAPRARRLLEQLVSEQHADAAYALLEALLYVRGPEVAELWNAVDTAFQAQVSVGAPWSRELLLAADAFAWRFPPDWRPAARWSAQFFESLKPADEGWALIRFLRGYHLVGLDSMMRAIPALRRAVDIDKGHEWTQHQAEVALWLVRWHFVHQCRARAQLAHQPWITQQYLCRSFHHSDISSDQDENAAELVRALSSTSAGWAFFLAENLRAIDPAAFGPQTSAASRLALSEASPRDAGVLAAVLTYQLYEGYSELVLRHFDDEQAQDALFEVLVDGLVVDGTRLLEPRFTFRRPLAHIYRSCGIAWESVKQSIPTSDVFTRSREFDIDGLTQRLEAAAREHPLRQETSTGRLLDEVLRRAKSGDLRLLNHNDHSAGSDPYAALLTSAVGRLKLKSAQPQ